MYKEEKIIGGEMLHKISLKKALVSPIHRSIGALTFKVNGIEFKGSAVLISKNIILTAAHNIYTKGVGEHTNFKFYLAPHGVIEVDKYYEIESWRYPKEFQAAPAMGKSKYDYAIMKLKQSAKYETFCELAVSCPKCKIQDAFEMELSISGYPGEPLNYIPQDMKGKKVELFQYGLAREERVQSIDYNAGVINYRISTLPGQSGCPVINEGNIIAVHVGSKANEDFNMGRMITFDLLENLKCWVGELSAHQFVVNCNTVCEHYQQYRESLVLHKQAPPVQIKERGFKGIFEKLSAIPLAEKQKATSLTLKVTLQQNRVKAEQ